MTWEDKVEWEHSDKAIKGFFGGYRWLSNFHPCYIEYSGEAFPSSENAYQFAKCANIEERSVFLDCTPFEAKKHGSKVKLRGDWDHYRLVVMRDILIDKFRDPYLRDLLLKTGDRYLEETNWWNDTYWGVCKGIGENNLGKILMELRENLRK